MNSGAVTGLGLTPSGINNAGIMVGSRPNYPYWLGYGSIADANGTYYMHDLINLGLPTDDGDIYDMYADAINDDMQVAGSCYYYVDAVGRWGMYLATPVPEPSSVLALGGGILALAGVVRRRR